MRQYAIQAACSGTYCDGNLGNIAFEFAEGTHTADGPEQEIVLEDCLVANGLATVVDESVPRTWSDLSAGKTEEPDAPPKAKRAPKKAEHETEETASADQ
jgi:hypothetical protein